MSSKDKTNKYAHARRFLDWRAVSVAERIRAEGRRLEFTAELLSALLQPPVVGLEALGIYLEPYTVKRF
jgi:hypothetical protein